MKATPRNWPEGVPFILNGRTLLHGDSFSFDSTVGALDILGTPAGTSGYHELGAGAETVDLGEGVMVQVASLSDLIRMKRAELAGRRILPTSPG